MEVTAALVKELRERTGAGMLDCKKMLIEANGDMDKAIDAAFDLVNAELGVDLRK